jgi:hypothetical protein
MTRHFAQLGRAQAQVPIRKGGMISAARARHDDSPFQQNDT